MHCTTLQVILASIAGSLVVGCAAVPVTAPSRALEQTIAPAQEAAYLRFSPPEVSTHLQCAGAALCLGACAPGDGHCRQRCEAPVRAQAAFLLATLTACDRGEGCDGEERCMRRRCAGAVAACAGPGSFDGL